MERLTLNLLPIGNTPVCHASQNDSGRTIRFDLVENTTPVTLSGTETIKAKITKPDDTTTEISVTNTSSTYIDLVLNSDDCDVAGEASGELVITDNGKVIGSKNFILKVEADAYDGIEIEERTASGTIATFDTNLVEALTSCKCQINAIQSGSGTPSPSNPRAITGFSGANIVVADENMVAQSTTNIPFGQTVYGGVLDVTNGKLTITHKAIDLGDLTYSYMTSGAVARFQANLSDYAKALEDNTKIANAISDIFAVNSWANVTNVSSYDMTLAINAGGNVLTIHDSDYTDATAFKTAMSGVQLVYELATPTEITLTEKEIEALLGTNNIYHDCNGQIEVKFLKVV